MPKFAKNNTKTNLIFKAGFVFLKPGVWTLIEEYDHLSKIFDSAEVSGQVTIQSFDTAPDVVEPGSTLNVEPDNESPLMQGLTAEQLQSYLAVSVNSGLKAPGKVESLGYNPDNNIGGSLTPPPQKPLAPEAVVQPPAEVVTDPVITEPVVEPVESDPADTPDVPAEVAADGTPAPAKVKTPRAKKAAE